MAKGDVLNLSRLYPGSVRDPCLSFCNL